MLGVLRMNIKAGSTQKHRTFIYWERGDVRESVNGY